MIDWSIYHLFVVPVKSERGLEEYITYMKVVNICKIVRNSLAEYKNVATLYIVCFIIHLLH